MPSRIRSYKPNSTLFLSRQETHQIDELVLRELAFQPLGHGAHGHCPPGLDCAKRHDVLLALLVTDRQRIGRLGNLDADHRLAILELDSNRFEARRDPAAGLKDRFDDVNPAKAVADARQVRADALPLILEAMAFEALRLGDIEKEFSTPFHVAGTRESSLDKFFLLRKCKWKTAISCGPVI